MQIPIPNSLYLQWKSEFQERERKEFLAEKTKSNTLLELLKILEEQRWTLKKCVSKWYVFTYHGEMVGKGEDVISALANSKSAFEDKQLAERLKQERSNSKCEFLKMRKAEKFVYKRKINR